MEDKFICLDFKESKKSRFDGNKLKNDLGNWGGELGSRYFVPRNGEYGGIIIELEENLLPLYLTNSVHQIYLNIESGYTNNMLIINKFNLVNLYQKYSNNIFKFIVDQFMMTNGLEPFYMNYQNIFNQEKTDKELIELKDKIKWDIHEIINVPVKVISCGSLLPESWIGKSFISGKLFHKSIDELEERIGKPPVTYLANYTMCKLKISEPEYINEKIINQYEQSNIFVLDSNSFKFNIGTKNIIKNTKYNYVIIEFDTSIKFNNFDNLKNNSLESTNSSVLVLFESDKIMESSDNQELKQISIGFNASLLQKSIRRGQNSKESLIQSINNLSKAKPYNNPEYSYELVSGVRQLFWRIFIIIIEETKIYNSEKYLDILDFVLYSYIFSKYPNYIASEKLINLVKHTMIKLQTFSLYWDFRHWIKSTTSFLPPFQIPNVKSRLYQFAILIGIKKMPGMKGDKIMLESTIRWLNTNPELPNIENLEFHLINEKFYFDLEEKITWFNSLDHHCFPNLILHLHNALFKLDKDIIKKLDWTLENSSSLIWEKNSKYNYRKHKFAWDEQNDLIYLIQLLENKNDSNIKSLKLDKKLLQNYHILSGEIIKQMNIYPQNTEIFEKYLNLIDIETKAQNNIIQFEKLKLFWDMEFDSLKWNKFNYQNKMILHRIGQLILSNQYGSAFWYKGKKTIPIYTNEQIKFKQNDKIFEMDILDDSEYNKILKYYLTNYKTNIKIKNKILNTNYFEIKIKSNIIYINQIDCVEIKPNQQNQLVWNNNLDKFIVNQNLIKSKIPSDSELFKNLVKLIEITNKDPIEKYILYKSLSFIKIKSNQIIDSDILNYVPIEIIKVLLGRIGTSIEDKNDQIILLLGKIDRLGKSTTEAVDIDLEGYLIRLLTVLSVLYGCFQKINNMKYIIHITPIYKKMGHFSYLFFSKKLFALKNK
jgi:hypothetical protein